MRDGHHYRTGGLPGEKPEDPWEQPWVGSRLREQARAAPSRLFQNPVAHGMDTHEQGPASRVSGPSTQLSDARSCLLGTQSWRWGDFLF